jgi:hypothetical protein
MVTDLRTGYYMVLEFDHEIGERRGKRTDHAERSPTLRATCVDVGVELTVKVCVCVRA